MSPGSVQFSFNILLSVPCQDQQGSLFILYSHFLSKGVPASIQPAKPLVWLVVGLQGHLWAISRCPWWLERVTWESHDDFIGRKFIGPIHSFIKSIRIKTYNSQHNTHTSKKIWINQGCIFRKIWLPSYTQNVVVSPKTGKNRHVLDLKVAKSLWRSRVSTK